MSSNRAEERRVNLNQNLFTIEMERDDIAQYLGREKVKYDQQVTELNNKITEITNLREKEMYEFREKLAQLEKKYEEMRKDIVWRIVMISGALKCLDLTRKDYEKSLTDIEQNDLLEKELARKEMEDSKNADTQYIIQNCIIHNQIIDQMTELDKIYNIIQVLRSSGNIGKLLNKNIELKMKTDNLMLQRKKTRKMYFLKKHQFDEKSLELDANKELVQELELKKENNTQIIKSFYNTFTLAKMKYVEAKGSMKLYKLLQQHEINIALREERIKNKIKWNEETCMLLKKECVFIKKEISDQKENVKQLSQYIQCTKERVQNFLNALNEKKYVNTENDKEFLKILLLKRYDCLNGLIEFAGETSSLIPTTQKKVNFEYLEKYHYRTGNIGLVPIKK